MLLRGNLRDLDFDFLCGMYNRHAYTHAQTHRITFTLKYKHKHMHTTTITVAITTTTVATTTTTTVATTTTTTDSGWYHSIANFFIQRFFLFSSLVPLYNFFQYIFFLWIENFFQLLYIFKWICYLLTTITFPHFF